MTRVSNPVTIAATHFGVVRGGGRRQAGRRGGRVGRAYTFQGLAGAAGPPVAQDDSFGVSEDGPAAALDVLANDTSGSPASLVVATVTQPAHGTAAIAGDGTTVLYTPAADYNGSDSFTYTARDANGTSARPR